MTRKELGHVELQWTCPNCGGINPGPEKTCGSCGAPQPTDVEFDLTPHQELITDESVKEKVEAGTDVHCPYCGTRNSAGVEVCVQCGGDLVEGFKRETGEVLGAYETGPVVQVECPHCGAENPETAKSCSQGGGSMHIEEQIPEPAAEDKPKTKKGAPILMILVLLLICGALAVCLMLYLKTDELTGTVQGVNWERSVPVLALVPVEHSSWQDQVPNNATIQYCRDEVRSVQANPAPNSRELCADPYTVDTGTGYGEVVQDCEYHVYDRYCTFSTQEWGQVDVVTLSGSDYLPIWPDPTLETGQRLGDQWSETYLIYYDAGGQNYTYTTSDMELFEMSQVGSQWNLKVNSFGGLVSVEK